VTQRDLFAAQRFRWENREQQERIEQMLLEPKTTYFILNTCKHEKVWPGVWETFLGLRYRWRFNEVVGYRHGDRTHRDGCDLSVPDGLGLSVPAWLTLLCYELKYQRVVLLDQEAFAHEADKEQVGGLDSVQCWRAQVCLSPLSEAPSSLVSSCSLT
jgi:hypothetical protein